VVVQKFCDFNVVGVAYFVGLFVVECHVFPLVGWGLGYRVCLVYVLGVCWAFC
jgi:hypothetical protein